MASFEVFICLVLAVSSISGETCSGRSYDAKREICCGGAVHRTTFLKKPLCCGSNAYDKEKSICCGTALHATTFLDQAACCGAAAYDMKDERCCGGVVSSTTHLRQPTCCGTTLMDASNHICCQNKEHKTTFLRRPACCGSRAYDEEDQACCGGLLHQTTFLRDPTCCNDHVFDARDHMCCGGNIFRTTFKSNPTCCGSALVDLDSTRDMCCRGSLVPRDSVRRRCCSDGYSAGDDECCQRVPFSGTKITTAKFTVDVTNQVGASARAVAQNVVKHVCAPNGVLASRCRADGDCWRAYTQIYKKNCEVICSRDQWIMCRVKEDLQINIKNVAAKDFNGILSNLISIRCYGSG